MIQAFEAVGLKEKDQSTTIGNWNTETIQREQPKIIVFNFSNILNFLGLEQVNAPVVATGFDEKRTKLKYAWDTLRLGAENDNNGNHTYAAELYAKGLEQIDQLIAGMPMQNHLYDKILLLTRYSGSN